MNKTLALNSANPNAVIKHVFLLMLENRSFDHMLGFSSITGTDAEDGNLTAIEGLDRIYSNSYENISYPVVKPADWSMPVGPGHEFVDVLYQLSGEQGKNAYGSDGVYPPIDNSGFVLDYVISPSSGEGKALSNFGEVMKCYDTATQLPVLYTLAKEFAVCDHWFSSLPGPTWPNRFFVHGASSNGLDDSPTTEHMALWEGLYGFRYENGSIFDALSVKAGLDHPWRIYGGKSYPLSGSIPCVAALHNIDVDHWHSFDNFAEDIQEDYPYFYTFIEPNYGHITNNSYQEGQSQHPLDDVRNGEALIKEVYETIRKSSLWENSVLIITYDEHGGFYDHVIPPTTVAPGDSTEYSVNNFNFEQLGVRVPAIVISPYIPKNVVDHRVYDHSSIPATLEALTGLAALTNRDANANNLTSLFSLAEPRLDTPVDLPSPADASSSPVAKVTDPLVTIADKPINGGNLPAFLFTIAKTESDLAGGHGDHSALMFANSRSIQTHGAAHTYVNGVMQELQSRYK